VPEATEKFDDWLDKTQVVHDVITAFPLAAMAATLNREPETKNVPPLWHWLYFLPIAPLSETGPDGHPKRGGFLPPVPLPRRMWAGGRLTFHAPLLGRTGRLVFVTVQHEIEVDGGLKIEEEHDIVYRDEPAPDASNAPKKEPAKAPVDETFSLEIPTDPVLLFRYSALTFNGHRIHYDHPYVTQEEGYPGLIVHGPLIATLLVDLVRSELPDANIASFAFRALRPTFAPNSFTVCGKPSDDGHTVELWAKDHDGYLTMRATATLA